MIYRLLLVYCDAPSGNLSGVTTFLSRTSPAENEAEESKKIIESTQILGIGSVLVAAVAFAGAITMPGGYRADDHHHGGALTLAGKGYAFSAFVVANALAFVCSRCSPRSVSCTPGCSPSTSPTAPGTSPSPSGWCGAPSGAWPLPNSRWATTSSWRR